MVFQFFAQSPEKGAQHLCSGQLERQNLMRNLGQACVGVTRAPIFYISYKLRVTPSVPFSSSRRAMRAARAMRRRLPASALLVLLGSKGVCPGARSVAGSTGQRLHEFLFGCFMCVCVCAECQNYPDSTLFIVDILLDVAGGLRLLIRTQANEDA